MARYSVTPYLNCDRDSFFGYRPEHALTTAADLLLEVEALIPTMAAEAAWVVGNRMGADLEGREWPADVRSMSVGDVLVVLDQGTRSITVHVCAPVGFVQSDRPITRVVPIGGQERVTSRAD